MFHDKYHSWQKLSYFISTENTQQYLLKSYKKQDIQQAEKLSFENCYPFIYYLNHGKNYYESALLSPLSIKPVLLFYGMIQLMKACILSIDPYYPATTSVLSHGVTTRKRKKQNYEFIEDEVKIQKNGLFTHAAKTLFQKEYIDSEKYNMYSLLARIPELQDLIAPEDKLLQIEYNQRSLHIPIKILDCMHMTKERFTDFLNSTMRPDDIALQKTSRTHLDFSIKNEKKACYLFNLFDQTYHIPKNREAFFYFPELLIHYLILYNLSMICRYETDWWGDLLHSYASKDYP
ncbi:MAG: YaaC family protein, partial [Bacillaceae bacterium]